MKLNKSTTRKLKDQPNIEFYTYPARFFGTILITLSGILLYLDRVIGFFNLEQYINNPFESIGWDVQTLIWYLAVTFGPILLSVGVLLKGNSNFLIIPIYCYSLQGYHVLFDFKVIDDGYYMIYALGVTIIIIGLIHYLKKLSRFVITRKIQQEKEKLNKKYNS